jgi:hypothetical protein
MGALHCIGISAYRADKGILLSGGETDASQAVREIIEPPAGPSGKGRRDGLTPIEQGAKRATVTSECLFNEREI